MTFAPLASSTITLVGDGVGVADCVGVGELDGVFVGVAVGLAVGDVVALGDVEGEVVGAEGVEVGVGETGRDSSV